MSDEKLEQKPKIDFSSIGGRCVRKPSEHPKPNAKPIDFSSIPGVRCVLPPPKRDQTKSTE